MEQLWLLTGFLVGLLVNMGDRMWFVLSEGENKSVGGFLRKNWGRLLVRLVITLYVYRLFYLQGWIVSEPIAFSVGLSFDKLSESFLDRMKKGGEGLVNKFKGNGG